MNSLAIKIGKGLIDKMSNDEEISDEED